MRTGRNRWEQREALRTGKTVRQVLDDLMREGGGKWETMAMLCGMSYPCVIRMYERNGITKTPVRNFAFRGVATSGLQHCRAHGLSYFAVKQYCRRTGVSMPDAMERYLTGQVKIHHWGVAQP